MLLTKDAILAAKDVATETVHVPEWGGDVCVRGMTLAARDALSRSAGQNVSNAELLRHCLVGEDGAPLFADAAGLEGKSPEVVDRLTVVALRLSGLSKDSAEAAEKNSGSEASATFSSSSPKN